MDESTTASRKLMVWKEAGKIRWQFLWNDFANKLDCEHDSYIKSQKEKFPSLTVKLVDANLSNSHFEDIAAYAQVLYKTNTPQLYGTSAGGSPGKRVTNVRTKITHFLAGAKYPYNTTGSLGWVAANSLTKV